MGTVVDGVQRFPHAGIKVIVAGGGIGGLGAALECWRKGCDVVVLEQGEKFSGIGDYFTITPSGLTTLKHYPSMFADYHGDIINSSIHLYSPAGEAIQSTVPEWEKPGTSHAANGVHVAFLKRRPVYAKMQYDQLRRLGVPVLFGQKVASVREEADRVIVKTTKGEEFIGDVCVGAVGIGGAIEGFDAGPEVGVQDSGYAVARVAFHRDAIKPGSPASTLLLKPGQRPEFRTYVAEDVHVIIMLCQDWQGWLFTHRSNSTSEESWQNLVDPAELITEVAKSSKVWDPAVIDFLRQTPTKVVDWKLRWRDSAEQWTSDGGRLVRLGDAAHAFFPTAGNGAVTSLEDGASLAECLRIGGKRNVTWATKVHNKLRFQRVSVLQRCGFLNREELHFADLEKIKQDPNASIGFFKSGKWAWGHDPEKYAYDNYAQCLAHLRDGFPFINTNMPPGHVFEDWNLESEAKRMAAGIRSDLKENGYWGLL